MNANLSIFGRTFLLLTFAMLGAGLVAQTPSSTTQAGKEVKPPVPATSKPYPADLVQKGAALFRQDCSFCHGRDAGGGESGPDLTRSKLVAQDVEGDKIGAVVRSGRPEKGMPPFDKSDADIASLVAFIHTQQNNVLNSTGGRTRGGGRKGVDATDLQTGNVDAGKRYFEGAGGCATCHSPTGDLAGIASRYKGLELEEQMLFPKHAKPKVTVTLSSGETISGKLGYRDEFTLGLIDQSGSYHSWRTRDIQYKIDPGLDAHVELFSKYTDSDVHNLMAYLQTLR
jgi:cytochrome c oxidase cbb3-type subunit III